MRLDKQPPRTLVIGYGNIDRADDGVAFCIVNALRRRLGQAMLGEDNTGLDELGADLDSIFVVQLTPDLADVLADYRQVIFVDAHVYEGVNDLHCAPVSAEFTLSTFTHHMTPSSLLALSELMHSPGPTGQLVSVRGFDFDFHRDLSPGAKELVDPAAQYILQLAASVPA